MIFDGKRILIVEGENLVAMGLASELAAQGAEVVGMVGTVDAALDIIATTDLSAVILDVHLRGQTSFLLADAMAARHIPFILETGYLSARDIPARYAGVPCIEKPFASGAVFQALQDVVYQEKSLATKSDGVQTD